MSGVTFKHLRSVIFCANALSKWCKKHGIDMKLFKSGVSVETLKSTNCPFAKKAIDAYEKDQKKG